MYSVRNNGIWYHGRLFFGKTTCKDRWRQVLNEADRLKDKPK